MIITVRIMFVTVLVTQTGCAEVFTCCQRLLPTAVAKRERCQWEREGWVFLKIPRGDIDGVGEVK